MTTAANEAAPGPKKLYLTTAEDRKGLLDLRALCREAKIPEAEFDTPTLERLLKEWGFLPRGYSTGKKGQRDRAWYERALIAPLAHRWPVEAGKLQPRPHKARPAAPVVETPPPVAPPRPVVTPAEAAPEPPPLLQPPAAPLDRRDTLRKVAADVSALAGAVHRTEGHTQRIQLQNERMEVQLRELAEKVQSLLHLQVANRTEQ